jgi:CubicO group peptidase (beta-lactamase class C family)
MAVIHGEAEPGYEPVAAAFAEAFQDRPTMGAGLAVRVGGRRVVHLWGGTADERTARPWVADTPTVIFSCTKGLMSVLVARLVQDGLVDYSAPVARYWPEFAANGKEAISVADVLSHRAGLAHCEGEFTLDEVMAVEPVVRALAAQAPNWEPGTAHGYHARTYGWLTGEIVRRITGVSLGTYFATELATPLGLDYYIGLPEALEPRVARLYPPVTDATFQELVDAAMSDPNTLMGRVMSGPSKLFRYDDMWNTRAVHATEMPSSNGIGDARSLAKLYAACLADVPAVDGTPFRALTDETVARATVMRSEGTDRVLGMPTGFGLGFIGPLMMPPGVGAKAFGHAGAGGSLAFADPDARLSFGYVMNQMQLGMTGDRRTQTLVAAAYASLE